MAIGEVEVVEDENPMTPRVDQILIVVTLHYKFTRVLDRMVRNADVNSKDTLRATGMKEWKDEERSSRSDRSLVILDQTIHEHPLQYLDLDNYGKNELKRLQN